MHSVKMSMLLMKIGIDKQELRGIITVQINTEAIQFSIAPLVNAAIRTRHNDLSVQMFLAEDEDEITEIYPKLKACREEQNEIVKGMLLDLMKHRTQYERERGNAYPLC